MATNTYVALDTKILTSNAASVTFSSINQGYTDLVLVCNSGQVTADTSYNFRVGFNTIDTGTTYSDTALNGNGSTASSYRNTSANRILPVGSNSSSILDNLIFHIQNYSNTTTYKTVLSRANIPGFRTTATVSMWRNTAAINTLEIYGGSNLLSGSTFTLYGIANSNIGAPKAFGGTITQDANYTYHTFGASGTFTPQQSLTADVLVVAGGGGSAGGGAGGGGAGGLLGFASQSLTATGYSVTVGSGGTSGGNTVSGGTGGDSQFGALTLVKGGGGGGRRANGLTGGSGGGAGATNAASYTGGAATSGQGFAGGSSITQYRVGGGGGAGGVGANGTSGTSGAGGIGVNTYSTWAATTGTGDNGYYAGGGGGGFTDQGGTGTGGAGGLGGGGAGAQFSGGPAIAGKPNTGGGGGSGAAATADSNGEAGGSGIVIIRYAN